MFAFVKSILRNLILPPAGLLLLAFVGLLLTRRHRRLGNALIAISLGLIWLGSLPVVANWLQRQADRYPPLELSKPVNAQAVVILAGGSVRMAPEYGGPAIADDTLERVDYGAYVARRTSLPVLVTGSAREAEAMRATLVRNLNITPRWVENRSGDTFENARFSARLLRVDHITRVILVTTGTHEWRAVHEFMAAGLQVVPAPVGNRIPESLGVHSFVPEVGALMHSHEAVYELIGEPVRELFAALHLRRQQPEGGTK
jgi:uncharacterized SAM-binding protein YcdF (DUF218 family)